jgi:hypothetical protein
MKKIIFAVLLTMIVSSAMVLEYGLPIAMIPDVPVVLEAQKNPALEIKGLKIGMTEKEAYDKSIYGFTIGGVSPKNPIDLKYHDGKLDRLSFVFTPEGFNAVLEAVKSKYPSLKCNNSSVSNAMGASFQQMICMLESPEATLIIRRFTTSIDTSTLTLTSQRFFDEQDKYKNNTKKDI